MERIEGSAVSITAKGAFWGYFGKGKMFSTFSRFGGTTDYVG
jgi:hypothetical protein